MYVLCFVVHCFVSFLQVVQSERAGCFALIVLPVSCDSYCYVALPQSAVDWSAVYFVVFPDHTHLLSFKNLSWARDVRSQSFMAIKCRN